VPLSTSIYYYHYDRGHYDGYYYDGVYGYYGRDNLNDFQELVVSLPTIQKLTIAGLSLSHRHLVLAVILILKHATFLCLLGLSPQVALTHTELAYQEANIDLKIQQFLTASSHEYSVQLFAHFIMATDIVPSQPSAET